MPRSLYIRQKVFSLSGRDEFKVKDQNNETIYTVKSKFFSLHSKIMVYDLQGNIVAQVSKELLKLLPVFNIEVYGRPYASIHKKLSMLREKYDINLRDDKLKVKGSLFDYNFDITRNNWAVGHVRKTFFAWSDTYQVTMEEDNLEHELLMVCLVLTIDYMAANANNAAAGGTAAVFAAIH